MQDQVNCYPVFQKIQNIKKVQENANDNAQENETKCH